MGGMQEKLPNIAQKCVICLTFIQLCFSGFTGEDAAVLNGEKSRSSLPSVHI
jgi:hypothetical protein